MNNAPPMRICDGRYTCQQCRNWHSACICFSRLIAKLEDIKHGAAANVKTGVSPDLHGNIPWNDDWEVWVGRVRKARDYSNFLS